MANQRSWEIIMSRIKLGLGERYRNAASWMARPKSVAIFIFAGYLIIFFLWLIYAYNNTETVPRKTWIRFNEEAGPFTMIWSIIVVVITLFASMTHRKWEDALHLRASQKQRIRILDNFQPSHWMIEFFDNRSIYDAVLSMLQRLDKAEHGLKTPHYNVCMLLCSPALDYWDNEKSRSPLTGEPQWGLEFRNLVKKLASHDDISFDVCHLPVEPCSGVNALKDFISALATYIIQSEDQFKTDNAAISHAEFQKMLVSLWSRSELVANDFASLSTNPDTKDRFRLKTHIINIPFQVFLVDSKDVMEVVVSFAGREVLERRQQRGVKGFFSSDPYVVKTFREVFQTYVDSPGRMPYIPKHTSDISVQHEKMKAHIIPSYYYNLFGPLHVLPESFSPVIGNSTKFTVWLLDKLLTTGMPGCFLGNRMNKILDVGSGTGVLALATSAILRDRCSHNDFTIIAIESCSHSQEVLRMNTLRDSKIEVKPWFLRKKDETTNASFKDENDQEIPIQGNFAGFDLVIADLPFVHAIPRGESDQRFLDCDHELHQALFQLSTQTELLARDGLLITAFSSLGGPEDIAEFERHVSDNRLQVIQRVDFHESSYMWMVYALMKKTDYDKHNENLWWEVLDAQYSENWTPTS